MGDWDFLWDLKGEERQFAMETGMTYADAAYLEEKYEEQEKQKQSQSEKERIKKRNAAWKELKKLRDSQSITPEEFKNRKEQIFAVEIERKKEKKKLTRTLKSLKQKSIQNKKSIQGSVKCLCFGCVSTLLTYHVKYDKDDTAICPNCNRKTVIPFDWEDYLLKMHNYYYPDEELDFMDEDEYAYDGIDAFDDDSYF